MGRSGLHPPPTHTHNPLLLQVQLNGWVVQGRIFGTTTPSIHNTALPKHARLAALVRSTEHPRKIDSPLPPNTTLLLTTFYKPLFIWLPTQNFQKEKSEVGPPSTDPCWIHPDTHDALPNANVQTFDVFLRDVSFGSGARRHVARATGCCYERRVFPAPCFPPRTVRRQIGLMPPVVPHLTARLRG